MTLDSCDLRAAVLAFCHDIGQNPLLVQGAGGNVSWKDGDVLWIKSSGTWLAEAMRRPIFVPVDLTHLRSELQTRQFAVLPRVLHGSAQRPSIETLLHACLPHRIVVHLHAVDSLACLVRADAPALLSACLPADLRWQLLPYLKPGAALAEAVHDLVLAEHGTDVIFLTNHGIVLGAETVAQLWTLLDRLLACFPQHARHADLVAPATPALSAFDLAGYAWVDEPDLQARAVQHYDRLRSHWALYPDHLVFLGAQAVDLSWADFERDGLRGQISPLVFVEAQGVFCNKPWTPAQSAQLRCYWDVLDRLPVDAPVQTLTPTEIAEILNWDAEWYRIHSNQQTETH